MPTLLIDMLDDVGEAALRNGEQVIAVPAARMPTRTGIAAISRPAKLRRNRYAPSERTERAVRRSVQRRDD